MPFDVGTCDHCGDTETPIYTCNYCDQTVCSEHRLPENHHCPIHTPGGRTSSFSGEGPSVRNRRSSQRTDLKNVAEPEPRKPRSKGDYRTTKRYTQTSNCPTCGKKSQQIFKCENCHHLVCEHCEPVYEHECPNGVVEDSKKEESISILERILSYFK